MPTNLEIAASKLLHPSNSKNFFTPEEFNSIQARYKPFPMIDFLREELIPEYQITKPEYEDDDLIDRTVEEYNQKVNLGYLYRILDDEKIDFKNKKKFLVACLEKGGVFPVDDYYKHLTYLEKQVVKNPVSTGNSQDSYGKLPSQDVNKNTLRSGIFSRLRGILSTLIHPVKSL